MQKGPGFTGQGVMLEFRLPSKKNSFLGRNVEIN